MSRLTNPLTINSPWLSSLTTEPANGLAMDMAMADHLSLRMAIRSRNMRLTPKMDLHAHLSDRLHLLAEALRLTTRNKWLTYTQS